jgi:hypothetical protein
MFVDSRYVDYIAVKERKVVETGDGVNQVVDLALDIVNEGNRRLEGSLLVAILGESRGPNPVYNIEYAELVNFSLRPNELKRYARTFPFRVPKGASLSIMWGPETWGPTAVRAIGPEEPFVTCAGDILTRSSPNPWAVPLASYALDVSKNFENADSSSLRIMDGQAVRIGKHLLPRGIEVHLEAADDVVTAQANLAKGVDKEVALEAFWQVVREIRSACGDEVGTLSTGVVIQDGNPRFHYRMFSPSASLSVSVTNAIDGLSNEPHNGKFDAEIIIRKHRRTLP